MSDFIVQSASALERLAGRAHQWLRALTVDPIDLRAGRGMKGKKHFVELLTGYRDLFNFYQTTNNHSARDRLLADANRALAAIDNDLYHDMDRCSNEQFVQESLSYLFACDLARFFGKDVKHYLAEITRILPRIYSHIPTRGACQRMGFVRRLTSLGLPAAETIGQLVVGTIIRQRKDVERMQKIDGYLIVHEVAHLTDNGQHSATLLNADDRQYLYFLFQDLARELKTADGLDLLAEVVDAMSCMQMQDSPAWRSAVQYVRDSQNDNGSFGAYELQREEKAATGSPYDVDIGMYLHTTVVCLRAALRGAVI